MSQDAAAAREQLTPSDAEYCAAIEQQLAAAVKYRDLARKTIERAALLSLRAQRADLAAAVKYGKGKLHQWVGAYRDPDVRRFARAVDQFVDSGFTPADVEPFARRALARHASTAERVAEMTSIYPRLFECVERDGRAETILDLCGGMHAFALPFFGRDRKFTYRGFDCDGAIAALADRFVRAIAADARVECRDVIAQPPDDPSDVAWLFKSAPCLERQAAGATRRLLERTHARVVVLSFPTRSLGGRDKGMLDHYGEFVRSLALDLARTIELLEFDSESFYLLRSGAS